MFAVSPVDRSPLRQMAAFHYACLGGVFLAVACYFVGRGSVSKPAAPSVESLTAQMADPNTIGVRFAETATAAATRTIYGALERHAMDGHRCAYFGMDGVGWVLPLADLERQGFSQVFRDYPHDWQVCLGVTAAGGEGTADASTQPQPPINEPVTGAQ